MKTVPSFDKDHVYLSQYVPYYMDHLFRRIPNTPIEIRKVDLRFCKPNKEILEMWVMHSIEHLMAQALYALYPEEIIDFSPMGCQTGFYLSYTVTRGYKMDIPAVIRYALQLSLSPTPDVHNCGNYKSHDESAAKEALQWYLDNAKDYDKGRSIL